MVKMIKIIIFLINNQCNLQSRTGNKALRCEQLLIFKIHVVKICFALISRYLNLGRYSRNYQFPHPNKEQMEKRENSHCFQFL